MAGDESLGLQNPTKTTVTNNSCPALPAVVLWGLLSAFCLFGWISLHGHHISGQGYEKLDLIQVIILPW